MIELLACAIVTAIVLVAEHIALWRHPWRLKPPVTYGLGVGTLAVGFTVWAAWVDLLVVAVAFWALAIIAGAPVVVAYWIRNVLAQLDEAAVLSGRLQRLSTPYTQAQIDEGGGHGRDRSRQPHRGL